LVIFSTLSAAGINPVGLCTVWPANLEVTGIFDRGLGGELCENLRFGEGLGNRGLELGKFVLKGLSGGGLRNYKCCS